ncbi:MAG: hypothetical protein MJY89_05555 [Bacteroidales bacterium]|nr:hypothetical protein [Bacteroidales bacterium]
MDGAFVINKFVSGKNFIGRQSESNSFINLVLQGENIAIYDTPHSGKRSFLQNSFLTMRSAGKQFTVIDFPMLSSRDLQEFVCSLGSAILNAFGRSQAEHSANVARFLQDTHFVFDPVLFESTGDILSLNWDLDENDIRAIFKLPYLLAQGNATRAILILDEFQNVMFFEDGDRICRILSKVFDGIEPEMKKWVSYVFVGSQYNAMNDIFAIRKLFYRQVNILPLGTINAKDIIDYVIRGFLASGKVVERELLLGVCKLFRCHIGYINELCFVCDSLSKGYIMEPVLVEALETVIFIHQPRFQATLYDLTAYQINLLKAIVEGHTKFSSSEVIRKYNLNSSANVRRLKDALCKKEVITFDENDMPRFLDPLFEYWIKKIYFKLEIE